MPAPSDSQIVEIATPLFRLVESAPSLLTVYSLAYLVLHPAFAQSQDGWEPCHSRHEC